MKKTVLNLVLASLTLSFNTFAGEKHPPLDAFEVKIDLLKVKKDRVLVTTSTPVFTESTVTFHIPKTVPGTYSEDNYGRFIEDLKAFDEKGKPLTATKKDVNSYVIEDATKLRKVTYMVNDSYDTESAEGGGGFGGNEDVFSPAGTNIAAGKNFMLNTHGFVGYFKGYEQNPYKLTVTHPKTLEGVSAMTDTDQSLTSDLFVMPNYAHLVEMPIMYSKPNYTKFMVDDMEIIISVYSPTGKYTAAQITPKMEQMMKAQKHFLGPINSTKKYAVLIYLSGDKNDAKGAGALEHPTSTTVVLPEAMDPDQLSEVLKDVVSHEFFHIVTPLSVHAEQIHYFDFNQPEMSEHLWMYEGVTEYFANLFQITEGLISEDEFYGRMSDKIANSMQMDDNMSFTTMSANVFNKPYKEQYLNVYQKGALIAMCIDIIMREESKGQRGVLNLMQDLSNEYGSQKPFKDEELFAKITALTYPSVGEFLEKHVSGTTPIPYEEYFAKVGVVKAQVEMPGNAFLKNMSEPNITIDGKTKEIFILPAVELNAFMTNLGVKNKDVILEINGKKYNYDNVNEMIINSFEWKEGDPITFKIRRDGKEMDLKGTVTLPKEMKDAYVSADNDKATLRNAWLKGK